jgi:hypothetical protein
MSTCPELSITGTLVVGPQAVVDTSVPSGTTTAPFALDKVATVHSGLKQRALNSASVYVTLSGVGTSDDVTNGLQLYLRSSDPILVRLTFDTTPADIVSEIPVNGLLLLDIDPSKPLVSVEAKGVATIEYLIAGLV